ncbi:MAG: hypothetical protein K1000chlam2_01041 [Chlamydiae bacterium]|nr:hypothetical protein [Chlamydiota bacterium]
MKWSILALLLIFLSSGQCIHLPVQQLFFDGVGYSSNESSSRLAVSMNTALPLKRTNLRASWPKFQFLNWKVYSSNLSNEKSVFVAILARDKAHLLPRYLRCLENQDYNKELITIYINTNNNSDQTEEILKQWISENRGRYHEIIFDSHEILNMPESMPHQWSAERFSILGQIRNQSLKVAIESDCDYYFVIDCDNLIAPLTLKTLVEKDKPIIAPILRNIPKPRDLYSNFFYAVDENGYYLDHPVFWQIFYRMKKGTFQVPLVHCTYLIKKEYLPHLTYLDGTSDYEFIIFSRSARNHEVDQFICNEEEFGVQFAGDNISLEDEIRKFRPFLAIP